MQLIALIRWQDSIETAIFLHSGVGSNGKVCPLLSLLVWLRPDVYALWSLSQSNYTLYPALCVIMRFVKPVIIFVTKAECSACVPGKAK